MQTFSRNTSGICPVALIYLLIFIVGYQSADAQQDLAQQAYAIFEQSCLNCHGEHGAYTEQLIIEHTALVAPGGAVIPGNPEASEFYQRLIETAVEGGCRLDNQPFHPLRLTRFDTGFWQVPPIGETPLNQMSPS